MINSLKVVSLFCIVPCWIYLIQLSWASEQKLDSELNITTVHDSAWLIQDQGYGTNIGVLSTEKGLLLIDPMTRDKVREELLATLTELSSKPVVTLLNTHAHQDHAGANDFFIGKGARLASCNDSMKDIICKWVTSHSSHDAVIYHSQSNTIFTGDVYDTSWHPTFYAGGLQGLVQAVDTILGMGNANSLVVPGHGSPTSKEELRVFLKNTQRWYARVSALLNQNLTSEAIAQDSELQNILQGINPTKRGSQEQIDWIPHKAYQKFVARTIELIHKEKTKKQEP